MKMKLLVVFGVGGNKVYKTHQPHTLPFFHLMDTSQQTLAPRWCRPSVGLVGLVGRSAFLQFFSFFVPLLFRFRLFFLSFSDLSSDWKWSNWFDLHRTLTFHRFPFRGFVRKVEAFCKTNASSVTTEEEPCWCGRRFVWRQTSPRNNINGWLQLDFLDGGFWLKSRLLKSLPLAFNSLSTLSNRSHSFIDLIQTIF